jgi:YD repeat-containing protein
MVPAMHMTMPVTALLKTNYLNNITEQYTYDPLYQLTQVTQGLTTTESYSYDPVGNRLSSLGMSPYTYNSSNELTSTPSATSLMTITEIR